MKLTYKILIIIFTIHFYSYAQQIPHYTQYMHNMSIINPAYVGVRSDISLNLQARQQWLGVEGAPKTQNFGINARTINNIALGLSVQNDAIGLLKQTNFDLNLSYTIILLYEVKKHHKILGRYHIN